MTAINGTVIYREIDNATEALLTWLEDRNQLWTIADDKNVEHSYVENDIPRDYNITPLIIEATTGFSLYPEDGGKSIGRYRALDKAIAAQNKARLVVSAETDDGEETQELPRGQRTEKTEDL